MKQLKAIYPGSFDPLTNGPAARIGEVLDVPLARPRRRLDVASSPTYLKCRQRVLEFLYERHRFIEAA